MLMRTISSKLVCPYLSFKLYIAKFNTLQCVGISMRKPPKLVFVSIFIVITLIGMSLSMITNSQNKDLLEEETKFFSHTNVNFEGYQEDSVYTYSTLSSGGWTQCVISEDTRVVCWGNNAQGKRGLGGGIGNASETPPGKAGPWVVGNLSGGMLEVSAGAWSTCSLKHNGEIWCWGGGEFGQLGTGTDVCLDNMVSTCNSATNYPPAKISLPLGKTAVSLSDANQGHFCAILDTGEGLCWGWNHAGQLGDGTECTGGSWDSNYNNPTPAGCNANNGRYTPVIVDDSNFPTNSSIISISTGMAHSCAIIDNNDLYCWGRNDGGQLGIGSTDTGDFPTPQYVDSGVVAVATGNEHSCALYNNQMVKCWGKNDQGQLGTGNLYYQNSPTAINLSSNIALISLETAYNLNCVISEDNTPYCWGANQWGQLGNYDPNDSRQESPLTVEDNLSVIAISLNGDTVCGIKTDSNSTSHNHRDVFCRGQSFKGQMGDGFWNQSWTDYNENNINLTSDYIGPQSYQGLGGIHISERDIDSDSMIAILDNLPYGCPDGSYDPNYDGTCVDADIGHYSTNSLYHSQNQCDYGTYQPNSGQPSCNDASPGYFVNSLAASSQQVCPIGTYQPNQGQTSCINSSPGYVPNLNSTDQVMCANGYYQPSSGQASCIPSSPGNYVPNEGSLTQIGCQPGTYQPNFGASSCIDASLGHFVADSNATIQEACSPGTYQSEFGSTSCIIASPGYYVDYSGAPSETACNIGTYNPQPGSVSASDCIVADPGNYVDYDGASTQMACPTGTYNENSNSITSDDCLSADPGYYVENVGSSEQTPCDIGYYQPSSGQTSCSESPSGTYVPNAASDSVIECSEGTYQPNPGQGGCLDTDEGYFTPAPRASTQTPCLVGSYQPETGSTACIQSDSGYHVPSEGQATQTICPAGTYQPQTGSSDCLVTNPGQYTSEGAISPSPCLEGSYQSESGQSGCVLADAGYYSSDISSTEQISCQPGEYQPLTGQSSCISASRGHYVDSAAATEETPCEIGSYQPSMSSTECILASTNYYVSSPGMAGQIACPSGESQPLTGQSSCNVVLEDSGIPTIALIGGAAIVALLVVGVLMKSKPKQQVKSGKKRKKVKKK